MPSLRSGCSLRSHLRSTPIVLERKEKESEDIGGTRHAQLMLHKFSACRLPAPSFSHHSVCHRAAWPMWLLRFKASRLNAKDRVVVQWSGANGVQTWHGVVLPVKKRGKWIQYEESPGMWPFPPTDESVRILQLRVKKFCENAFAAIQLGTIVRHVWRRGNDPVQCWRGVVVAQCEKGLVVMYNDFPCHPLLLPPPKKSGIISVSVTFRARSPPNCLRQQRLRFRRAVARAVAAASPTPPAHPNGNSGSHESLHLQTHALPERRSISSGLRIATANVLTLSDRGRLLSMCGWMERNKVDILALQETRLRLTEECELLMMPPPNWRVEYASANAAGGAGVAILLSPSVAPQYVESTVLVEHRAILVRLRTFNVISVYAPTAQHTADREVFFNALFASLPNQSLPCYIVGDPTIARR